jgi:hypothetical protein
LSAALIQPAVEVVAVGKVTAEVEPFEEVYVKVKLLNDKVPLTSSIGEVPCKVKAESALRQSKKGKSAMELAAFFVPIFILFKSE